MCRSTELYRQKRHISVTISGMMRNIFLWTVMGAGLALVALTGCSQQSGGAAEADEPVEELPILWERHGVYSRIQKPIRIVALDRGTLAQLPITEVEVDFKTQMVLIVGMGPTFRDDIGVRIVRVWRQGGQIQVQERQIHPGDEAGASMGQASPWSIVVVPRSDLNVAGFSARVPPRVYATR